MGRRYEAFYETQVECVVGCARAAVAVAVLVHAVCAISTAGTLDEAETGVYGGVDVAALQGSKSADLKFGYRRRRGRAGRLHFEGRTGRMFSTVAGVDVRRGLVLELKAALFQGVYNLRPMPVGY
jgi:hypothetical protein